MPGQRQNEVGQVKVRGTQDGLVMRLPVDVPMPALLGQVRAAIDGGGAFFQQAQLVLDYGDRVPNIEEIVALRSLLSERGVAMRTVTASVPAHRELLRTWGYHPLRLVQREQPSGRPAAPAGHDEERHALYVRRTLRSGAAVQSDGDVIVLGDVNAGAEVQAVGDVIVWGTIRGTVHAGVDGDESAIICALRLMPTQLRIASIFARPPDQREDRRDGAMVAHILGREIVVEPWRADRRPGR